MRITLKSARQRKGWTPEELAARASLHRATVYRLESNTVANPSSATVSSLEKALGLRPGSLVFGIDTANMVEAQAS